MAEATTQNETPESSADNFISTRNYTDPEEKQEWWCLKRWYRDWMSSSGYRPQDFHVDYSTKEQFRKRRTLWAGNTRKALRMCIGNSDDIGAFVRLTNSYMLVGSQEESENFCRIVKEDLPELPVISTSLSGCRVTGRMCVGNKYGLIVPESTYDTEFHKIKEELPESVEIRKIEERLSALGNVVACNDHVALIHPDLDKENEEIIANTLQVEVFRHCIADNPLVGSLCVLNNKGGLVCKDISNSELENLSSLLQLPLAAGTVNRGEKVLAATLCASDIIAYAGMKTTASEFAVIESIFQL